MLNHNNARNDQQKGPQKSGSGRSSPSVNEYRGSLGAATSSWRWESVGTQTPLSVSKSNAKLPCGDIPVCPGYIWGSVSCGMVGSTLAHSCCSWGVVHNPGLSAPVLRPPFDPDSDPEWDCFKRKLDSEVAVLPGPSDSLSLPVSWRGSLNGQKARSSMCRTSNCTGSSKS